MAVIAHPAQSVQKSLIAFAAVDRQKTFDVFVDKNARASFANDAVKLPYQIASLTVLARALACD